MKQTITTSACTLSWINGKTGLRENDGAGPQQFINGRDLTKEHDTLPFRFVNLLEVTATFDGLRVTTPSFTQASGIYRNPSFMGVPSEPFLSFQSVMQRHDRVVFEQTVGARTVTPEVIGEDVGGAAPNLVQPGIGPIVERYTRKIGRAIAHQLAGFPPIWTRLRTTIFANGRTESEVICHSLFPSMSFYRLNTAGQRPNILPSRLTDSYALQGTSYDAVPNLDRWKTAGWGALIGLPKGPCRGNPWNYNKNDLSVRPYEEEVRIA